MNAANRPLLPAGLPFGWRGVALLLGAVLAASALLDPAWVADGPTLCPLRAATGVPCPGCGLTRSFVAAAHGDLAGAFGFHPFGPALLLAAVALLLTLLGAGVTRRTPPVARALGRVRPVAWAVLAAWLVWAAVRAVGHLG